MRRLGLVVLIVSSIFAGRANADPVSDWNAAAVTVMLRTSSVPRGMLIDLAYVHAAIYDAVNAIDGRYEPFAVTPPNAAPWASKTAAVAAAASLVLVTFYPGEEAYINAVYAAAIDSLPDDSTTARGFEIGETVAVQFLALRSGDGRSGNPAYTWHPVAPGVYQPTPPGASQYQPGGLWMSQFRPFALSSTTEFRSPPPVDMTSDQYAQAFNEVKIFGSANSTSATPEQREAAWFHTEHPYFLLSRNIRSIASGLGLSLEDNARLFAQLYITIADAQVTGFESLYFYNYWRPVTAVRAADSDGNLLTEQDVSWEPLAPVPQIPEYPDQYGCNLGGLAYGLERFFGTSNIPITLTSTVTSTQHSFASTDELRSEVVNARVWGGSNFRASVEAGMEIARRIAEVVAGRFAPVSGVGPEYEIAQGFRLDQNYPNPFNPNTTIGYALPQRGFVQLAVFNTLGQRVAVLHDGEQEPGYHEVQFNASGLASGLYVYRLTAGNFVQVKKLLLLR